MRLAIDDVDEALLLLLAARLRLVRHAACCKGAIGLPLRDWQRVTIVQAP